MFRNYINIALRSLKRQKSYSLINIFGLSSGIMACIVILLYVKDEFSYERFYPNADKIYRVTSVFETSGKVDHLAVSPARLTTVSQESIPETEDITFVYDWSIGREMLVEIEDQSFLETEAYYADTSFFKVFEHKFIEGDLNDALSGPNKMVLTESTAQKYFGKTYDLVGELLSVNGDDVQVTAVIEDFKGKTSLEFEFLLSMETAGSPSTDRWFPMNYFTYLKVKDQAAADSYLEKVNALIDNEVGEQFASQGIAMSFEIEPITEMHFTTTKGSDYPEKVSKNLIYSLVAIAGFILLIACINYINLSTAKSEKRAKEVGVRKVLGAYRRQLIWQFYGETLLVTTFAVVIGVVLAELLMPFFNNLANTNLSIDLLSDPYLLPGLIAVVLFVSLVAGSYPASFLSSFQPAKVLKSTFSPRGGNAFRRVLVTVQFAVSVFLITGTLVIYNQLNFIQNREVGYDQEQIVYMQMGSGEVRRAYNSLKSGFMNVTGVEEVTGSNNIISNVLSGWGSVLEDRPDDFHISFRGMSGDDRFLETFGFDLVAGESFKNKSDLDSTIYYLVNRTGIEALELTPEEAIGKRFGLDESMMGTIVGVIDDFHLASLHKEIEPLAVYTGRQNYKTFLYAKVNMERLPQVKAGMQEVWDQLIPNRPFELKFVDDSVRAHYEKDQQLGQIILSFTILAIAIGCLGLFGLASYLAEKRTKEIGIRKVLGADVQRIVFLLSKEYLRIVLIANVIGWPLAYFFMEKWLSGFAYRISLGWYYFIVSGVIAIAVALITVSYQSFRAAFSNPINSLRYE